MLLFLSLNILNSSGAMQDMCKVEIKTSSVILTLLLCEEEEWIYTLKYHLFEK